MSFLCRYFISDGHEVDINFILQIFIDEHELVPIAKGIDRYDHLVINEIPA